MTLKGPSEPCYKFRAKCEPDMFRYVAWVLAIQPRAQAENVNRLDDGSVTCELMTTLSLDHLRDLSRIGGDLYAIAETIKLKADYDADASRNRAPIRA